MKKHCGGSHAAGDCNESAPNDKSAKAEVKEKKTESRIGHGLSLEDSRKSDAFVLTKRLFLLEKLYLCNVPFTPIPSRWCGRVGGIYIKRRYWTLWF